MFLKLLERDKEEALRISARSLKFPDGIERTLSTWRFVWHWYDALLAYEYCPAENVLLADVLKQARDKSIPVEQALGQIVQGYIRFIDASGGDVTDDTMRISKLAWPGGSAR